MIVSYFPFGSTDRNPHPVGPITFEDLATVMAPGDEAAGIPPGQHMIRPAATKLETPAWSPCEYRAGSNRAKANVLRVGALVIDFDGGTAEQLKAIASRVGCAVDEIPRAERAAMAAENVATLNARLHGLAHIAHTSWSHNTDKKPIALRIAVKLSRAVEAAEWPKFWRNANAYFGGLIDPATKDASRLFFCAALPVGTDERQHRVISNPGEALDVDRILGADASNNTSESDASIAAALGFGADGSAGKGNPITLDEINEFAHEIARSKNPKKSDVGRRLKKMVLGEPFALSGNADPLGGIDNAIFRMCAFLAERFFDRDANAVAKMFERSLAEHFKRDGDTHTLDSVVDKFNRVADEVRQKRTEADKQVLVARGRRIREAFQSDRVEGYTPDELLAFGDMDHKWVIQNGSSFYLFFDGDYRPPVGDKAVIAAAARDLAPAHTAGVEVFESVEGGVPRPKSPLALVLDYGAVSHDVIVDLTAQRSHFDSPTRTFVEASCPRRVLEAKYNPAVDEWIRSIGSEELEQWIALCTRLDRPCAALYAEGVKGAGKSLLAHGLARLWSTGGPTTAANAIGGTWNDDIARCPLVFADEALPPKVRASGYTGEIREFIQANRRPLARRYKPNATMIGAVRMILAANNKNLLETNEALTPNDIAAIAERFIYVFMPQAAADVLARYGRDFVDRVFLQEDGLAGHALWLAETKKNLPNGRFFFEHGSEEIARTLTTQSGMRGSVCTWLVMFLLNPGPVKMLTGNGPAQVFVDRGELYASAQALATYWPAYKTNRNPPSPAQAGSALRGLSHEGVIERDDLTFYHLDRRNLLTWAEESGYCSAEQISRSLAGLTDDKNTSTAPHALAAVGGSKP